MRRSSAIILLREVIPDNSKLRVTGGRKATGPLTTVVRISAFVCSRDTDLGQSGTAARPAGLPKVRVMNTKAKFLFLSIAVWGLVFLGISCLEASQTDFFSPSRYLPEINFSLDGLDSRDKNNKPLSDEFSKAELEGLFIAGLCELLQRPDLFVLAQQLEKLQKEQNPGAQSFAAAAFGTSGIQEAILFSKKLGDDQAAAASVVFSKTIKDTSSLNTVKDTEVSSIQNQPIILRC